MSAFVCDNPAVMRGLERQLARRRDALAGGAARLGWKTGMSGAAVMESLGTTGALVGYLTDATLLADGATVDVGAWHSPVLEPELAIRIGSDLAAGSDRAGAAAAIDALAPAIELADTDLPFEDPEALLAGNLFHRAVLLGSFDEARAGADLDGVTLDVTADGRAVAAAADPLAIVGDVVAVALHVAAVLERAGEGLLAGDVVITGSAIPAVPIAPGERFLVDYGGIGSVSAATAPAEERSTDAGD
ncbi:MAG TPA: fumarylacetoacetate hydrolase family protein [Solirubrobacterales bacterium]|nr:fumarylacetoacetate hydrolase family protein [Solirubrobacterales bacterium]